MADMTQMDGGEAKLPELKLDARQAQGFLSFFRGLPPAPHTIRFFDRRDYYTVHGPAALFVARVFYKTLSAVRYLSAGGASAAGSSAGASDSAALPSVSVNRSMFESILRHLLLEEGGTGGGGAGGTGGESSGGDGRGISAGSAGGGGGGYSTVELYEGGGASWRLARAATPGRLTAFEDVLFATRDMGDSPTVCAVIVATSGGGGGGAKDGERRVGLAFVDLTKRAVGMTDFLDDEQYTCLESALVALSCRECVVPQEGGGGSGGGGGGGGVDKKGAKSLEARRLRDVMSRCNVLIVERKRAEFKPRDVEQDLGRLLRGTSGAGVRGAGGGGSGGGGGGRMTGAGGGGGRGGGGQKVTVDSEIAGAAMAAVLAYADLLADDSNYGRYTLLPYSLHTHMRLDATALRALNVTESKTDGNRNFSLMGLMNRTCTAGMGKRLLNRWLKQPLVDEEEIKFRLDVVQSFVESGGMRQEVRGHLRRMPDIERLTRRLEMRRAGLQDVVKLYQASIRLPFIREVLETHGGSFRPMLHERFGASLLEWCGAEHLAKYEGLVEAAVDLDALQSNGEYLIAPGYDPSLGEIKEEREGVEAEVQRALQQAANDLGLIVDKTIKLDKTAQAGYCYRITKKEETNVRKKLNSSYVTLETRKDGVKFTNAKLRRLSERHVALTDSYMAAQRELVAKVVEVAQTFLEVFEGVAALIAEMDVLQGFAELAASAPTPYVRPSISGPEEGDLVLEDSRHPCVEVQDDVSFIPNHCRLERGRSWFQIITGPNMGGKSTFIRQVGVVVLMAQVGSFVPCSRAHVSIRDAIFARVGAGDCQLRGVSTFMAEMLETAAILHAATPHSLVIIDELGRGTSTYDGFGLAWAICEHLVDVTRAPTLFATHFHELTALETRDDSSGVANFHVSAHIDEASRKLTMLYKVQPGPCDQSFGIHVAEFAHFPPEVVAMARAKAQELEDFAPPAAHGTAADTFSSKLLGANEVPKNDSKAAKNAVGDSRGIVYMKLSIYMDDDKPKWVKYTVKTSQLKGEMPPTKTHVHTGEKGKNGDVLLDLPCHYEKKGDEEWRCEGSLGKNKEDRSDSLLKALKDIVKKPSGHYGNIHTKRFPDGAVRGQFAKE
ncbi:unnamed protein product [Closterium sp. Naga37s-1]|nr:unnamed protein product [Closterium sp. Naga37s-1]